MFSVPQHALYFHLFFSYAQHLFNRMLGWQASHQQRW